MKKISLYLTLIAALAFTGCDSDDDPIVPEQPTDEVSEMTIEINHVAEGSQLEFNSEYVLPSNETVIFRRLAYILSKFYLKTADGAKIELNDQHAFIDVRPGKTSFVLNGIPTGEYVALGLSIGLDSSINHGNPNVYGVDHPLAPINNSLHWSWQGGYIFTAIEGKTIDNDESFVFHLAGAQNRLDFELPFTFTKGNAALIANLNYDIMEVFQNPEVYTLGTDGASTHSTTSANTLKLIGNMSDVMSIVGINE